VLNTGTVKMLYADVHVHVLICAVCTVIYIYSFQHIHVFIPTIKPDTFKTEKGTINRKLYFSVFPYTSIGVPGVLVFDLY
jgi:hypothetical protein